MIMIKIVAASFIFIVLSWSGCHKMDVGPICLEKQFGAIRVNNEGRDKFEVSIPAGFVSSIIDGGGYILVNNIPSGSQKVNFVNQADNSSGQFFVDVKICDTVTVSIK